MKRLFAALCLILILPLLLAEFTVFDYPDVDLLKKTRLKPREVKPTVGAKVGTRNLDSLRGLG